MASRTPEPAEGGGAPGAPWARLSPRRAALAAFALAFLVSAAWSVATPPFAAPDEPTQVVTAAAAVRGEVPGRAVSGPLTSVRVPGIFVLRYPGHPCFAFAPDTPASCARDLAGPHTEEVSHTYSGRYPPLYYLVVGLPSLAWPSRAGFYAMRLLSAAVSALFIAGAFYCAFRARRARLAVVGVLVAMTPVAVFLSAVVNPNGLEISAATCVWAASLALAFDAVEGSDRAVLTWAVVSAVVLVLSRGLSPLWLLVIALVAAGVAGRRRLVAMVRRPGVRAGLGVVVVASAGAVTWIRLEHSLVISPVPLPPGTGAGQVLLHSFSLTGLRLKEMVGIVGWGDTPLWSATVYLWAGVVVVMLAFALLYSSRRVRVLLGGLVLACVVLPVLIESSHALRYGYVWVGRYTLPMAVGVPILSAFAAGLSPSLAAGRARLLGGTAILATAVAQYLGFIRPLQRYTVGIDRPLDLLGGSWRPPAPVIALLVWYLLATGLLWLLGYLGTRSALRSGGTGAPSPSPGAPADQLVERLP